MAAAERIDRGYLGLILQLTLLAPDIVEAILHGRQPCALTLPWLLCWSRCRACGISSGQASLAVPARLQRAVRRYGSASVQGARRRLLVRGVGKRGALPGPVHRR